MEKNLWVRAIDYARAVKAGNEGLCAHDYKSGAEEERILLLEWVSTDERLPEEEVEVLVKLERKHQRYSVAKWDGKNWWQPLAPNMGGIEHGGWFSSDEPIVGWRYIEEL